MRVSPLNSAVEVAVKCYLIPNMAFKGHHPIIPVRVGINPTTAIVNPLSTRHAWDIKLLNSQQGIW